MSEAILVRDRGELSHRRAASHLPFVFVTSPDRPGEAATAALPAFRIEQPAYQKIAVLLELGKLRDKYHRTIDSAIISFAVTYYTGKADTVAHIPERCYTADGYEPTETETEMWDLKSERWTKHNPGVRYISFEDQAGTARVRKNVAYFFHVNGEYQSDPKWVRIALQNLFQKHGYYSKVKVMAQGDREKAAVAMKDFLTKALPEVEKCLPDWSQFDGKNAKAPH